MEIKRDETIRLTVCFATRSADIAIWAQVYDPATNTPLLEIGKWSLEEFGKIAPTMLRAYWCGKRGAEKAGEQP